MSPFRCSPSPGSSSISKPITLHSYSPIQIPLPIHTLHLHPRIPKLISRSHALGRPQPQPIFDILRHRPVERVRVSKKRIDRLLRFKILWTSKARGFCRCGRGVCEGFFGLGFEREVR